MSEKIQNDKQALVPRMRFPEFRGAGEWEAKKISETCRVTQGGTPDTKISDFWGGEVQWLTPAEMGKSDSKYITKTVRSITKNGLANCSSELLPLNSVIISTRAPIGHIAINHAPMAINQGCRGLVPNSRFDFNFIYYSLEISKSQLNDLGSGNTFKELSGNVLKGFIFGVPQLAEQQKIADCLSSLDALIAAQSDKLDALKNHKKGLMQQLFPREDETFPRLRFPEFRDAGEWEEIKFIDVADKKIKWSFIGGPFGSNLKSSDYVDQGIRIIQLQNIGDAEFLDDYKIYTTEEKADELLSCNIFPGDIILSKMGDPVGRACIVPKNCDRYLMCSDGIRLVVNEHLFCKYFIYLLINSFHFRELVEKTATGSTRKRIGLDGLKNLPIFVPKLKDEQQKIADCLSSLDALIAAHAEKLDALKTHKKGLMQQLFPVIDRGGS